MNVCELGVAIQAARLNKQITQAKLCEAVRISRPTLSLLETGKLPEVGIRKVLEVLTQLGLELTLKETRTRPTLRDLQRQNENAKVAELTQPTIRKRAPRAPRVK